MTVPFDLVNLVMSETGVLKKFRHNYFLKNSHCAQIAKYFCSRRSHRKRYSKKGRIHVNVIRVVVTLFK